MSDDTANATTEEPFLKVGAGSNPQMVASAIAHALYDKRKVMLRAVGAGAVNQSVKAIAIARGYVAPRGFDLTCRPGFANIPGRGDEGEISAIVFALHVA